MKKTPAPSPHTTGCPSFYSDGACTCSARLKTPEPQLIAARNWYRRRKKIPLDAPLKSRADVFNRPRRGTGNVVKDVSMPREAWLYVDSVRGRLTRGELIQLALKRYQRRKKAN